MPRSDPETIGGPNVAAFLDMLAFSEGTAGRGDDGYNVLVGGGEFNDYSDHPRSAVQLNDHLTSTAAGRYQLLARYFTHYRDLLRLRDFSPPAQDQIALQQIRECHAVASVQEGDLVTAVGKCRHIWASLPGAGYGQREVGWADLQDAFVRAGGRME